MTFDELGKIVEGKRIVIIGRAPYILESPHHEHQGQYIDNHDIVVRVNSTYPYGAKHSKDGSPNFVDHINHDILGRKTHLFYLSCAHMKDFHETRLEKFDNDGGIAVCSGEYNRENYRNAIPFIESVTQYHEILWDTYLKINEEHFNLGGFKITYDNDGKKIRRKTMGTLGIQALKELLLFDFKSIYLMGFTCCFDKPDEKHRTILEKHSFHRIEIDLLWLFQQYNRDKRIIIDDTLKRIFREQKGRIDELESELNNHTSNV